MDLSAFGHRFRPDSGVCKAAGEACQTAESSKSKRNAGKSRLQAAVFHLQHVDALEVWVGVGGGG